MADSLTQADSSSANTPKDSSFNATPEDSNMVQKDALPDTMLLQQEKIIGNSKSQRFRMVLPMEGDVIHSNNLEIVIALGPESFSSVSILLDGYPLPNPAEAEGALLIASANNLDHGIHRLNVIFLDSQSKIVYREEVPFFVQLPEPERAQTSSDFSQSGILYARSEFRGTSTINEVKGYREISSDNGQLVFSDVDEKLFANSTQLLHATYRMKYKKLQLQSKLSLNSQESRYRQPYNRFGGRLSYGPWLTVAGGDVYPQMNDLVLKDLRVRGIEAKSRAIVKDIEWYNLHFAYGNVKREINPHVLVYQAEDSLSEEIISGSFERKLSAFRLGFGSRDQLFSLGLSALKTWDIFPQWDPVVMDSIPLYSPEENVVTGVDFQLALFKRKVILYTDYAFSLWTANRNATIIGSPDSRFELHFTGPSPDDLKSFMAVNASTQLDVEHPGRNSALQTGIRTSFPLPKFGFETELMYYSTGDLYRSEGNPFFTTSGEKGLRFLQRVKLLENRMAIGLEGSYANREIYSLDTNANSLNILSIKGDVRYSPHITLPSIWIGLSGTESKPEDKTAGLTPKTQYSTQSLYLGGFHQVKAGPGKLHINASYSITNNENYIYGANSSNSDTSFSNSTNVLSTSLQYRRPRASLIPFVKHSLTSNSIRKAINNFSLGSSFYFTNKISGMMSMDVGQYPVSAVKNDLKLGESITLSYNFQQNQSLSFNQRFYFNGPELDYIFGGNYELFF